MGVGDHGLFQISDIYWCSPPGRGWVCGISCAKFEDSDISDDVECMKKIYDEHQRLSGDGFNAWSVYKPYCKDRSEPYIEGCFDYSDSNSVIPYSYEDELKSGATTSHEVKSHPSDKPKVFERCELAVELYQKHKIAKELVPTYVCIAYYESKYNTSAVGHSNIDGSSDHGIFQISDIYWCSPPGMGRACGLSCDQLEDFDITNDVECMKKIYDEHQHLSGDGFNAWSVYSPYCKGQSDRFLDGCFIDEISNSLVALSQRPAVTSPSFSPKNSKYSFSNSHTAIGGKINKETTGKIYDRCELAREFQQIHNIPMNEIPVWVCIAYYESKYNTSAVGRLNADGSADHGLFQISDIYWCSLSGRGNGCSISCSDLENSNITDDIHCIKQIYREHSKISGDGFTAWSVYLPYCKGMASQFTDGCFEEIGNSVDEFSRRPGITAPPKKDLHPTNSPNSIGLFESSSTTLPTKLSTLINNVVTKIYATTPATTTGQDKHPIPTISNKVLQKSTVIITTTESANRPSASSDLTERQRVQSLFEIYFNGFRTRAPTTLRSLSLTTHRPLSISNENVKNVSSSLHTYLDKTIFGSKHRTTTNSKDSDAPKKAGVFSDERGTGFIFGSNVISSSSSVVPTIKLPFTSSSISPLSFTSSERNISSSTKFPDYNKNPLNSTDSTATISSFKRPTTPATVTSKLTYQSMYGQRPSLTTLQSLPAYYSNRLTTTNSPSINQIINTHDNTVSMFNNRFTRVPSSSPPPPTPINNFKLTSSQRTHYDHRISTSTTAPSPFDKIFDLFVH